LSSSSEYDGINAKIKGMRGQLLRDEDYETLARAKTVEEVALSLRGFKPYERAVSSLERQLPHRGMVEQKIISTLADDFRRIYRFIADDQSRRFLSAYFLKNEIRLLKQIMAAVRDKRDVSFMLSDLDAFAAGKFDIDAAKLLSSRSVPDFIENLRGTGFHSVLAGGPEDGRNSFDADTRLDIYYYVHLWRLQNTSLEQDNQEVLALINGAEIDMRNILWIYRMKIHYSLKRSDIYAHLIPVLFRLRREKLARMVEAPTADELRAAIAASPYGEALGGPEEDLEQNYYTAMSGLLRRQRQNNPDSLAPVVDYLFRKELEIKNITSLIEGVRYALRQADILRFLVLPQ
jgi:V/A-type H+-transporting ATPase subunit C